MVASSRRELDALNAGARAELTAAGQLGEAMTVAHREMAVGERVLIGRGGPSAGLPTGMRATVVSLDTERGVLELRTEQGRTLSMSAATAAGVELRHAYATTARDARRARPDLALILGDGRATCASDGSDRRYVVDGVGRGTQSAVLEARGAPGLPLSQLGPRLEGIEHRLARAAGPDPTAART